MIVKLVGVLTLLVSHFMMARLVSRRFTIMAQKLPVNYRFGAKTTGNSVEQTVVVVK